MTGSFFKCFEAGSYVSSAPLSMLSRPVRSYKALEELRSRLKRAERRSAALEEELGRERKANRMAALHCRKANQKMAKLKVIPKLQAADNSSQT